MKMVEVIAAMFSMSVLLLALAAMWLTVRDYGRAMWNALIGEIAPSSSLPDPIRRLPVRCQPAIAARQEPPLRAAA